MDRNSKERLDRFCVTRNGRLVRRALTAEQAVELARVLGGTAMSFAQWVSQVVGPQRQTNAA